jgi:hypothetical protein
MSRLVYQLISKISCFLLVIALASPIARADETPASSTPSPQMPLSPPPAANTANPHLVGWGNLVMPGLGETLRGNPVGGLAQFGYETSTFVTGYFVSPRNGISSLDGITDTFQPYRRSQRNDQLSIENELGSDMLLEFAIKTHMLNTYIAYRDAYKDRGVTEGLDQRTWWEGFKTPFQKKSFEDPWVYVPIALIAIGVTVDYLTSQPNSSQGPLTPTSNFMYTSHYGIIEPLGSGWPEEAFYRGFLQHEFTDATNSPLVGILAESAAFAFSHEEGNSRWSAGAAGAYLGYLSWKNEGNLGPGLTVHFWGDFLLGLESILLSNRNQRTTPQSSLGVQFNY